MNKYEVEKMENKKNMIDFVEIRKEEINLKILRVMNSLVDAKSYKLIERYKANSSRHALQTTYTYLYQIKRFLDFVGLDRDLKKLSPTDINNYLGELKQHGKSEHLAYCALYNFAKFAEGKGNGEAPKSFKQVEPVKKTKKATEALDFKTEIEPMFNACSDSIRNKTMLWVLYEGMLRRIEFLALRVKDIDLSKSPAPINVRISKTESGTKRRAAFLINAIPFLRQWLDVHPMKGTPDFNNVPLFVTRAGKPMSDGILRNVIKTAQTRAKIKRKIYPHLFRHSRAYELAKGYGYLPQELMKIGGWANSSMLDTYYNPTKQDVYDKANKKHGKISDQEKERLQKNFEDRKNGVCPCGHTNPYDSLFCQKCGAILNIKKYQKAMKSKADIGTEVNLNQLKKMQEEVKQGYKSEIEAMKKAFDEKIKSLEAKA